MSVATIPFTFPGIPNVGCAFQRRASAPGAKPTEGGNIAYGVGDDPAAVAENRKQLQEHLHLDAFADLAQVHGDVVVFEPLPVAPQDEPTVSGDGLATTRPGLGLMIKSADCQPVLLAHKDGRHIAALHVGWRGNRINFIGTAVAQFCEHYSLSPKDVLAVRGPSLGPINAEFVNFSQDWGQDFASWYASKEQTMDLWSLTRQQLADAGLIARHIYGLDMCTATMNDIFFSYRCHNETGRQASVIWIKKA